MKMVCATCTRSYHIPGETLARQAHDFRCRACEDSQTEAFILPPVRGVAKPPIALRHRPYSDPVGTRTVSARIRRLFAPVVVVAIAVAALTTVAARARVVAKWPLAQAAYAAIGLPVNTRGLAIEDVHARFADLGDKKVLMIDGSIVNLKESDNLTRDLRVTLLGSEGRELYVWKTRSSKTHLGRLESARFSARLEAPPEGVTDVLVKFVAAGESPARDAEGL